jgi:histidinol-phosphatase (PHP family)
MDNQIMNCSSMHVHTDYCDGSAGIEDYCNAAFNKGFSSIGFSSHAPLQPQSDIVTDWHLKYDRIDEYIYDVRQAQKKWAGKLDVFLGLEADYIEDKNGKVYASPSFWNTYKLDYILGSVHYVSKTKTVDAPLEKFKKLLEEDFGGDCMALIEKYYANIEHMLQQGGFDILSHADLIKKHNVNNDFFNENDERYKKQLTHTAELIADVKMTVEVNTGGMNRGYTKEPYPSKYFLSLLNKNHTSVILNSDAHTPEHLDGHYKEALVFLREAGYSKMVFFKGRDSGGNVIWKEESI